jgi:hypothetical protein
VTSARTTFFVRIDAFLPQKGLTTSGAGTTGGATIYTSGTDESVVVLDDAFVSSSGVGDVQRVIVVFDLGKIGLARIMNIMNRIRCI